MDKEYMYFLSDGTEVNAMDLAKETSSPNKDEFVAWVDGAENDELMHTALQNYLSQHECSEGENVFDNAEYYDLTTCYETLEEEQAL